MSIKTSYLGNLKFIPNENIYTIMRVPSKWSKEYVKGNIDKVAPSMSILERLNSGEYSEEEFTTLYIKELDKLPKSYFKKELDGKTLLCSCVVGSFCHRHVLSEYIETHTDIEVNEIIVAKRKPKVEIVDKFTNLICKKNLDKIYVFADTMDGTGNEGQAKIRNNRNSFGIPILRSLYRKKTSFLSDNSKDKNHISAKLKQLKRLSDNGKTIVFHKDGLGITLDNMGLHSPMLHISLHNYIQRIFGISVR